MEKQNSGKRILLKKYLIMGIAVLMALAALTGCGTNKAENTDAAKQTASSETTTQSSNPASDQRQMNPAVKAAMDVKILQDNQSTAFNTEQKQSLKPILQELINKSNPTEDYLQEKADAITAVFTDNQNSYLNDRQKNASQRTPGGTPPEGTPAEAPPAGTPPEGTTTEGNQTDTNRQGETPGSGPGRQALQPAEVYQQALKAIS